MPPRQFLEPLLVVVLTCPEQDELHILVLEHLVDDARDEVDALVRHKSRDHRHERRTARLGKPELSLQAHLVVDLALGGTLHVVVDVDLLVRLRVVDRVVDPVDNPEEILLTLTQESVEMLTVVLVLDLLGVGLADG